MDLRTRMALTLETTSEEAEKVVTSRNLILTGGIDNPISVKRGDHNSRVLKLTLRKDVTTHLDLSKSDVFLVMLKPNGIKIKITGEVTNAVGGEVVFALDKDALSTSGEAKCEVVRVGQDGTLLSSPAFAITIEESLFDDFMLGLGEDEFTVITE